MNHEDIFRAIGAAEESLLEDVQWCSGKVRRRWLTLAACLCLAVLLTAALYRISLPGDTREPSGVNGGTATLAGVAPLEQIIFGSLEEYYGLLEAAKQTDPEFQKYLEDASHIYHGIAAQEDVAWLEEIMSAIPFPVLEEQALWISVVKEAGTVSVVYDGNLSFVIDMEANPERIEVLAEGAVCVASQNLDILYCCDESPGRYVYVAEKDGYAMAIYIWRETREEAEALLAEVKFIYLEVQEGT